MIRRNTSLSLSVYDTIINPILTYLLPTDVSYVIWLPYSNTFKALTEVSEDSLKKLSQDPMVLTRIRISAHNFNIERGRYAGTENTMAIQRLYPYFCMQS